MYSPVTKSNLLCAQRSANVSSADIGLLVFGRSTAHVCPTSIEAVPQVSCEDESGPGD